MRETVYRESLDNAIAHALEVAPSIAAQRDAAPLLLAELLELPDSTHATAVATERRFQTYSLASYVLEKCKKTVSCNLKLALAMARLARVITRQIDPRTCGGIDALADLGAYALAMEGNVQRVCGHWPAAIASFARAREVQKRGGTDPDLMARINLLESSLRRDMRQFREALQLLDRVAEVCAALDDEEQLLRSQINRANLFLVQRELDGAGAILEEILSKTNDPQSILLIRHNLATTLVSAGRAKEAARLIEENRGLYLRFSDPLLNNRRLWLEGRVAREFGQDRHARSLLQEASNDLDERGYAFDAALARLDLAKLQAEHEGEPLYPC
ncbi:MAG TPA: hypothetical protein VEW48_27485 [Thermoanaerobaculia bacterium]|nr:hypothetical protein [Thermoanaerobaculia bacterium]